MWPRRRRMDAAALCAGLFASAAGVGGYAAQPAPPNTDAAIADLKARTAALVAAQPPLANDVDRPPAIWRAAGALQGFRDGADGPEMVVIPAGEFTMGSPETEAARRPDEGPRHRVRIGYAFAVSKYPVTVADYTRFVADTGRDMTEQCQGFTADGKWDYAQCNWSRPGFPQGPDSPVVAVSWQDAEAFTAWLAKKTGKPYRLLSEAEYEYVARAGTTTAYPWGDDPAAVCGVANTADLSAKAEARFADWNVIGCRDGHPYTAPVGAFGPNAFGVHAMTGNTWSWTQDCWAESYVGAPVDGSPRRLEGCRQPAVRGGSWADVIGNLRAASRGRNIYYIRFAVNGFRLARDL